MKCTISEVNSWIIAWNYVRYQLMISLIRLFPLLGELHVAELSVKIPVMQLHLVHFILYVH